MNDPADNIFTIEQLAGAAGISRATVLRIEEAGLISPCCRKGRGNARYYDAANALKLFNVLSYKSLGFSMKETVSFFAGSEDYRQLLNTMEQRLRILEAVVSDLRSALDKERANEIMEGKTAPFYCCVKKISLPNTFKDISPEMMDFLSETIIRGYRINCSTPATLLFSDDGVSREQEYTILIHVDEACKNMDDVMYVPATHSLYINCFGELSNMRPLLKSIKNELIHRHLVPISPFWLTTLIIPYTAPGDNSEKQIMRVGIAVRPEALETPEMNPFS